MKTIRKLVHREIITAVAFVTLGFLALFFFFDLIDELRWVGRSPGGGYEVSHAMLFVALSIPSHLYELLPITVLIGTIFVMARLAQSSEFTIMRTSGLGPGRALRTLLTLGGMFVLLTFTVGDYLAPLSDRAAQLVKASQLGRLTTGATGAWLKERQEGHSFAVNVRSINPDGSMHDVRIFEFDGEGRLVSKTKAVSAQATKHACNTRTKPACAGPRRSAPTWWPLPCSNPTAWPPSTCSSTSATSRPTDNQRSATRSSSGARCSIR